MPRTPRNTEAWILTGVVASGLGKGTFFVSIDWVFDRLTQLMAGPPFPGTLNLRVAPQHWNAIFARRKEFEIVVGPGAENCPGYLAAVQLRTRGNLLERAWIILPEATEHSDILEIVSPHQLRSRLALSDGDTLEIHLPGRWT